jgi:hypothetical protein
MSKEIFIYSLKKQDFESKVQSGEIDNTRIGIIAETAEIWVKGEYYPLAPDFAKIGSTTADQFKTSANSVNGLVSGGVFTQYDVGDGKASYHHLTKFKIDALGAKYLRMSGTLLSASSSIKILEL